MNRFTGDKMNEFEIKSEAQKQEIVDYLRGLGLGKVKPDSTKGGICKNLSSNFSYMFDKLICTLAKSWEKHSGREWFPIAVHGENPCDTFDEAFKKNTMWEGQYGDDRRELCLFIADKLETMELDYS